MKIILIILAIIALLVVVVIIIGYSLPVEHSITVSAEFAAPKEKVWNLIVDAKTYPEWRADLKKVEVDSTTRSWTEYDKYGDALSYEVVEAVEGELLVTRIKDKDKPFGGSWTITLQESGSRTQVTITENGEVYNPVFRFVSRFIMGHAATADQYLANLKWELEK